jgi:hypothetical protein
MTKAAGKAPPESLAAITSTASTPATVEVIEMLLRGENAHEVEQAIRTRWPDRDPAELLTQAVDTFNRAANASTETVVGWALEAYRSLYAQLIAAGDYAGALRAVSELVKLKRAWVPDPIDEESDPA